MSRISEKELLETIADALQLEPASVDIDTTRDTIEGWDSLGQLNVLIALDKKTGGQAGGIAHLAEARSVREIMTALRDRDLI
jgi:acyl carrier protein